MNKRFGLIVLASVLLFVGCLVGTPKEESVYEGSITQRKFLTWYENHNSTSNPYATGDSVLAFFAEDRKVSDDALDEFQNYSPNESDSSIQFEYHIEQGGRFFMDVYWEVSKEEQKILSRSALWYELQM